MKKLNSRISLFVAALCGYVVVIYLIFGVWLSAARHSDHLNDMLRDQTVHHVTGQLSGEPKVTELQNGWLNEVPIKYLDYNGHEQVKTISVIGDQIPVHPELNVYKDGHIEVGYLSGSYSSGWPIFAGILWTLGMGATLVSVAISLRKVWRKHRLEAAIEEQLRLSEANKERERAEREAKLSPNQLLALDYMDRIKPMTEGSEKAELMHMAQQLHDLTSEPESNEAAQLRNELSILLMKPSEAHK